MNDDKLLVTEEMLLYDFLRANIKNKSKNNIKSNLQRGNVLVNGRVVKRHDHQLKKGQSILVKWSKIQTKENIDIIYEDNDLIVINKPTDLLSVSTIKENDRTAFSLISQYLKTKNPRSKLFIVHRLDRETSGVMIFAKNEKMKLALQNKWNDLVIKRGYVALVEGVVKDSGEIESWLTENKNLVVYSTKDKRKGKYALTKYDVIKRNNKYSLLNVEIKTGRKNQIRVHMKDIGHPVVGDKKYGSNTNPIKRMGLHASCIKLTHPFTNKEMVFEVSTPFVFNSLFK